MLYTSNYTIGVECFVYDYGLLTGEFHASPLLRQVCPAWHFPEGEPIPATGNGVAPDFSS